MTEPVWPKTRYASGVYFHAVDGEQAFFRTGDWFNYDGRKFAITAITITDDLPGLHANMERVRVWQDDHLLAEAPLHAVEMVTYPRPLEEISSSEPKEE